MAVKVRCPQCSKVLNAPDTARGKAVRCPGCEAKVPVPAADAPAKSSGGKPPAKVKAKTSASDADFLSSLNLETVEDQKVRICPKCGTRLGDEDDECPECGVDTRTGQLTARERRKRSRGGPDTSKFWGEAWSVPWDFLKTYWGVPVKLALMQAGFATIAVFAIFAIIKYCAMANTPPTYFWGFVGVFFGIGIPGMTFTIMQQIVVYSMEQRDKEYEPKYDMFAALANGVKFIVWSVVMPLPFFFTGIAGLLSGLAFPIAIIHMTRPYVHPAWSAWDMLRLFVKNATPCLYLAVMNFVLTLPAVGVAIAVALLQEQMAPTIAQWVAAPADWLAHLMGAQRGDFLFEVLLVTVILTFAFVTSVPYFLVFTLPAVFMMRAYGEFGYYFKGNLDLINRIPKNTLAGFWPRYLGYLIDSLLCGLMLAAIYGLWFGQAQAWMYFNGQKVDEYVGSPMFFSSVGLFSLIGLGALAFYWAASESSATQGTLGMRSIGLIVTDMNGRRITMGTAMMRFIMRIVGGLPLGFGYIMCAFNPKKQTLHDVATKTLVVFEGD